MTCTVTITSVKPRGTVWYRDSSVVAAKFVDQLDLELHTNNPLVIASQIVDLDPDTQQHTIAFASQSDFLQYQQRNQITDNSAQRYSYVGPTVVYTMHNSNSCFEPGRLSNVKRVLYRTGAWIRRIVSAVKSW